jgi:hypothetical protein
MPVGLLVSVVAACAGMACNQASTLTAKTDTARWRVLPQRTEGNENVRMMLLLCGNAVRR